MKRLERSFFDQDTVEAARALLGKYLVRVVDGQPLVGRITETEAYIGRMDKACHAYQYRRTPRTETLFARPGTAYIYLIYGMHHCLNFVTEPEGEPAAVLIRGFQPVGNRDIIANNLFHCKAGNLSPAQRRNFVAGPGRVCRSLALTREQNGMDLMGDTLYLCDSGEPLSVPIHTGPRIGIDYAEEARDFPWRFWVEGLPPVEGGFDLVSL